MRTTNSSHFPLPTRRKLAFWSVAGAFLGAGALAFFLIGPGAVRRVDAQEPGPSLTDPNLTVLTVASGFTTPIGIAFLGANDWFVIEKQTGQVKHLVNGAVDATVLDLAVNNASERGLLSIALHPNFATNHFVYLFWTCQAAPPPPESPFFPTATTCADTPELGADTGDILAVPLLGNRVDRFVWDAGTSTLTFDKNLIKLRSFQNDGAPDPPNQGDEAQPPRGNHNGGVTRFGPDGKLYIFFGDQGRRGQLQNLPSGPTLTGLGATVPDDQFGGPEPDNAHFSGVVIRLNDDGSTPTDNPFFAAGASMGGEVGANVQKIFAYGLRNSFGLAFDPESGNLWESENGEDAYDELNRIEPGMNGGWIQIQGPSSRVPDYRFIETTFAHEEAFPNLQQFRWGPERIAQTPAEALSRLFMLGRPLRRRGRVRSRGGRRRSALPVQPHREPPQDRSGRARPRGSRGRQRRVRRAARKRAAGDRREIRDRHRHQDGPEREPVRRLPFGWEHLRDLAPEQRVARLDFGLGRPGRNSRPGFVFRERVSRPEAEKAVEPRS